MKRIIIFASGSGSNANNICQYFAQSTQVKVVALFCNNAQAGVIPKMQHWNVPVVLFTKADLQNEEQFTKLLLSFLPDAIVLAGFLLLMPPYLVRQYPNRIINIHPALLPKYGGKGMYGQYVHQAVLAQKETEHGITIHLVNEKYDDGKHLFQQSFEVTPDDNMDTIAAKIALLETTYFPKVIDNFLTNN